jgi:hypothetical protein
MYLKTENLIKFLFDWQCDKEKFYDCVLNLSQEMAKRDFWSYEEVASIKHWLHDLSQLGYIEPTLKNRPNEKRLSQILLLESSIIDVYFKVRYTPKFQQSIDFDNYCCQNESNSLEELHDKFLSLKYLKNFCNLSNYNLKYNIDQIETKSKQSDITLLITFNIAIRSFTIELIKHIYGSYFKNVIFCGKNINTFLNEIQGQFKKFDSYTFIDVDTVNGVFHYDCMTKAIQMNFNTKGILLMSDDVLLKYWELDKLNVSQVWFPEKIFCSTNLNYTDGWMWWSSSSGLIAYEALLDHMKKLNNSSEFAQTSNGKLLDIYLRIMRSNSEIRNYSNVSSEKIVCTHAGSDIFFIPKLRFDLFHLIGTLFRYFNVFLELAVPGILNGLDANNNMAILNGQYDWSRKEIFNSYDYEKIGTFFHPSKLIFYNASALGTKFCEKFIQNKCSHF